MSKEEKLKNMLESSLKIVGSKQVLKGLSDGTVRCVIVALDTDAELKNKIVGKAKAVKAEILFVPSRKKLGEMAGVEVATATLGIKEANT